eukprot:Gb_33558 [translate_table: standard]
MVRPCYPFGALYKPACRFLPLAVNGPLSHSGSLTTGLPHGSLSACQTLTHRPPIFTCAFPVCYLPAEFYLLSSSPGLSSIVFPLVCSRMSLPFGLQPLFPSTPTSLAQTPSGSKIFHRKRTIAPSFVHISRLLTHPNRLPKSASVNSPHPASDLISDAFIDPFSSAPDGLNSLPCTITPILDEIQVSQASNSH